MKIFCVGRNYADHAKELNNAVPDKPVIFMKPDTALLKNGEPFYYPDFSTDIHPEIELVLKVCKEGKNVSEKFAPKYVSEIGVGLDFTARDLQSELKTKGLPWEIAKAFNGSALAGGFKPLTDFAQTHTFQLKVNDAVRQSGTSTDMIFGFAHIISYISKFFTLRTGDLIFTGTPAGVGSVQIGDMLKGYFEGDEAFTLLVK
jgi:2-keto-4-pentenoate hydratase/2-oxohepta-3-ene-1,7-dioic acid hydratase in catechol pathway